MEKNDLLSMLDYVDPSLVDYAGWINIGMALKQEGCSVETWDEWSRRDPKRYHHGECEKKWRTFNGSANPVTGGTIYEYATRQGWSPEVSGHVLDWNDTIYADDDLRIVDNNWIQGEEIVEPVDWNPTSELIRYLEALFESTENVGYVTSSWQNEDGKFLPSKGSCDRTAGELIQALSRCNGDIGAVLGDYNPDCGAWIRFNPLDGNGVKDENVTDYRYALVESDSVPIEKQNAILRKLELPIAMLVYSGGKSLHAIVRVDAADYSEYRKRVDYLFDVCEKNGLHPDGANRNPSRLSRMPGVMRGGRKQFIVASGIGKRDFAEWKEWIEGVNDDLPDVMNLSEVWDNLPDLSPCLIDGVLRQGHKMLLAGPSKAGKSFALIELCIAIAEGREWFGFRCTQGKVMYINLELDRASCLHRFRDVYSALGWTPEHVGDIDIWNLRGRSVPLDLLAPRLIRRAKEGGYIAIVLDPIYKVITGDENAADQMAKFCNNFDKIATELDCAVIYCHHHSKGQQGQKRSMDRASGSGVFARDPDALIDMLELDVPADIRRDMLSRQYRHIMNEHLKKLGMLSEVNQCDLVDPGFAQVIGTLPESERAEIYAEFEAADKAAWATTAWRIEGTLREFAGFRPLNVWFDYPIHRADEKGDLKDLSPDSMIPGTSMYASRAHSEGNEKRKKERDESIETAFEACTINGTVTIKDLAEYLSVTEKTVRRRLAEHGDFWVNKNEVGRK
nr:MAG TPA: Regulatory protein repA [Caudoviricetes sp.]